MWFKRLKELLTGPRPDASTPRTLEVESKTRESVRPVVFDPALCHFLNGMRGGEPQFKNPATANQYVTYRYQMLQFILECVMKSEAAPHLVLRGSAVMRSWFPEEARHPGDLDWVVAPHDLKMKSPHSEKLLCDVVSALRGAAISEDVLIRDEDFVVESIWTYDRAPGVRILVPWSCPAEPLSTIQMDFVFEEELAYPPVKENLTLHPESGTVEVIVAGREQSLAWKLLWLATDMHPMGKDLYDAVLLAESTALSPDGLMRTVTPAAAHYGFKPLLVFTPERFENIEVEWDWFVKEYPHVQGDQIEWRVRLASAIRLALEQLE